MALVFSPALTADPLPLAVCLVALPATLDFSPPALLATPPGGWNPFRSRRCRRRR